MVKKIGWALWSLVLLVVLAGLCYYVYGVSTGKLGPAAQKVGGKATVAPSSADPDDVVVPQGADSSIGALLGMPRSDLASFKVGNALVFRSESGHVVCSFSDAGGKLGTDLILPYRGADGSTAASPSIQCGLVRALDLHTEDQVGCVEGNRTGDTLAVWPGGRGIGACVVKGQPLRYDAEVEDNPEPNQRMKIRSLEYGKRIQKDGWACGDDGENLVCAELASGRGFLIGSDVYRLLGPEK